MPEFEEEQNSRLWRWMVGIVALAAVVWLMAELTGSDRPPAEQATAVPAATESSDETAAVQDRAPAAPIAAGDFQAWVRDSADVHERMNGIEYAAAGLERLLSAVRGIAAGAGDSELDLRATALQSAVDRLSIGAAQDVGTVRDLLLNGADLIASAALQRGGTAAARDSGGTHVGSGMTDVMRAVARNIRDARDAAESLDPEVPLDRQRHRVFNYFDHMSEAVMRTPAARP